MSSLRLDPDGGVGGLTETTPGRPRKTPTTALAFVLLAGICAAYFAFIHEYAVNALFFDQWSDVQLLGHWYSGTLSLSDLWLQHGENRILFPNLVVLLLARSVHDNIIVEQYLSGLLLVASVALIIWTHKRRSPAINWLWYVPVGAVLLSIVQYADALWGFQLAWYMVYFSLALSLYLLDRPNLTWFALGTAVVAAVVGSYSSAQGLLIWPVGLLLLYQRHRLRVANLIWVGCAVATGAVYLYHLRMYNGNGWTGFVLKHPITGLKYYFLTIGDVLGIGVPSNPDATTYALMALGLVIFLIACWVLFTFGRHRDETSGAPLGVALTAFGVLFAAMVTFQRAYAPLYTAASSHYTTFDLLIPVGCGLTLLGAWTNATQQKASGTAPSPRNRMVLKVVTSTLIFAIALQLWSGTVTGINGAHWWYAYQQDDARATVDGSQLTEAYQDKQLLSGCACGDLPQWIQIAREHHLGPFGTGAAAVYVREGPSEDTTPPKTRVLVPLPDSILRGRVALAASSTTDVYRITRVVYLLSGDGLRDLSIASARPSIAGWLALWNTATVPNGSYVLQGVAYDAAGKSGPSPGVQVQVANP